MSEPKPTPQMIPLPGGPYYFFTDFEPHEVEGLRDARGCGLSYPRGTVLCRCGESSDKPFCDGAHLDAGFVDGQNGPRN